MYEIQWHPASIRKPVRYFFLTKRQVRILGILALLLLGLFVAGFALAPAGVKVLAQQSQLKVERSRNQVLREVLSRRVSQLEQLQKRIARARNLERQIALILGVPTDERETGGAGYPENLGIKAKVPEARSALAQAAHLKTETDALLALARELEVFAKENEELTRAVPSICPLPAGSFVLTSPFGERISPFTGKKDFHAGIDLAAKTGTPVYATGDGKVVFAGRYPHRRNVRWWRYGNLVVIAHAGTYVTIYAHLDQVKTRKGKRVKRGEIIGTVGNTGWSTSPHLHYEVRVWTGGDKVVPVDPRIFILDYRWKGFENLLVARRWAPPPKFDPLPRSFKVR